MITHLTVKEFSALMDTTVKTYWHILMDTWECSTEVKQKQLMQYCEALLKTPEYQQYLTLSRKYNPEK